MSEPGFSSRLLQRFIQTAAVELGTDQLNTMLTLASLPGDWDRPERFRDLDARNAAETYAALQAAMRTYYGRGARGVLLRVGQRLWHHLLEDAALTSKAQAAVIRRLPRINKQPHPGDSLHFGGTCQCSRDLPAFLQGPIKRSAQPFERRAPVQVTVETGLKKDQVR